MYAIVRQARTRKEVPKVRAADIPPAAAKSLVSTDRGRQVIEKVRVTPVANPRNQFPVTCRFWPLLVIGNDLAP